MFTEEEKLIIEDVYLSLVNDREQYLKYKNWFSTDRLKYSKEKLVVSFKFVTYSFRYQLSRDYCGDKITLSMYQEIAERVYDYLFGRKLFEKESKEPTDEEISEFTNEFVQEPIKQEKEMSIEQKNAGVPVANVTLVFGKDIKSADDNSLIDLLAVIDSKGKAIDHLDKKSKYYQSKIKELNNARSEIQDELDSRV